VSLAPTSELVALAWLGTLPDLTTNMVDTTLPADQDTWAELGFVTLGADSGGIIGGTPNKDMPLRAPVVSVHCWAVAPGSARPPWNKAAVLAEQVVAGTFDETTMRRILTLPAGYSAARLNEAYPLTEPRRIPGDQGGYAHYQLDLQMHWVALT
jgi:hypothetical protein